MGQLTELTGVVYRQLAQRAAAVEQVCASRVFVIQSYHRAVQGGIITGLNPVAYNAGDPFPLWVIQIGAYPAHTPREKQC